MNEFKRTSILIGEDNLERLNRKKVAIFGIGGVGSYVVEALARSGIGRFVLVDNDVVTESNINRQIIALHSTLGRAKVDVMKERILDINPFARVETYQEFYDENSDINFLDCDYVVDAIDSVKSKIHLIVCMTKARVPVISSMGAGNRLDPTKFLVDDIYKTSVCPLARVMRKQLRQNNIERLKVVYSKEVPKKNKEGEAIASISYVPSVAGMMIASEVINDLMKREEIL